MPNPGASPSQLSEGSVLEYFRLREQPFGVTPDPHYLYLSPTHRQVLASLAYGVEAGRGPLALIAEPGLGKTTLLVHLKDRFGHSARVVTMVQGRFDLRECLLYLLNEMGANALSGDLRSLEQQLREMVTRGVHGGRRFVLVVDEAQDLEDEVLEGLGLTLDFEAANAKRPQIVMAGQPSLADKLARPALARLRKQITLLGPLTALTAKEADQYINHRLRLAGYEGDVLFTQPAIELVASQSEGVPRNINNICFTALNRAYVGRQKNIDFLIVQEAVADLDFIGLMSKLAESPGP